uniref:OTU domain-containing protein n=1 Tax=viral metagenome TaxID=1070528 RepID=A0A6C0F666_9ZZZZ
MSCLFNSLSYFIKEDSYKIRQTICDYLKENKPIIDGLQTIDVIKFERNNPDNYIENMRVISTWGGAIEIQCACNIWNLQINVLNYRDTGKKVIEFLPLNGNANKTINIYWTGGHFEPIKEAC